MTGIETASGLRAARLGVLAACVGLAGCEALGGREAAREQQEAAAERALREIPDEREGRFRTLGEGSILDLFRNPGGAGAEVAVNRFLWDASLDVLDFLPIEAVDPFTGVIVMGFGTPPGGGTAYRATVYVQDPALDARSLNVALATRAGPAPAATQRAVEDAILTRARQLRVAAGRL